jgi:hypothetical protein
MIELFISFAELIGAVTTMAGSYYLAKGTTKTAFIYFIVSNTLMFYVAMSHGLVGLSIQMIIFSIIGINMLMFLSSQKNKTKKHLYVFYGIYFMFLLLFLNPGSLNFTFGKIDLIAAVLAIAGTLTMKYNNTIKLFGFISFFIADLLYIYIANENHMWFFMIQSFFFLYTSLLGIYTLKIKQRIIIV